MPEIELAALFLSVLCWLAFGQRAGRIRWPVLTLLVIALAVECLSLTAFRQGNTWLFNLYIPLDFLAVAWLITAVNQRGITTVPFVGLLVSAFAFAEWRLRVDPDALITTTFTMGSLGMVVWSGTVLIYLANTTLDRLLGDGRFWLLVGQLLYYGGMIPYNALVDHLYLTNKKLARELSDINLVLATMRYISTLIALFVWMKPTTRNKSL